METRTQPWIWLVMVALIGLLGACSAARPFEEGDPPFEGQPAAGRSPAQKLQALLTQAEVLIEASRPNIEEGEATESPQHPELIEISRRISQLSRHPDLDLHPSSRIAMRARAWFLTTDTQRDQRAALEDLRMLLGTRSKI